MTAHWRTTTRLVVLTLAGGAWCCAGPSSPPTTPSVGVSTVDSGPPPNPTAATPVSVSGLEGPATTPAAPRGTSFVNNGTNNGIMGPYGTINVTAPTPRRLTEEQIYAIGHALGRYRGMRVNLVRYSSAGQEGADLANDILAALTLAKMQVSNEIGAEYNDTRTGRPIPGLLVEIGPRDPVPGQMDAAEALVRGMTSLIVHPLGPRAYDGFGRGGTTMSGTEDPDAALHITVGLNAP